MENPGTFKRRFIADSYASRAGKGIHRAVDRRQQLARSHRHVLRLDIVQHFASADHALLTERLHRVIRQDELRWLTDTVIASGAGVLDHEYRMVYFPGDDLLAACRPRRLPIGKLTSPFWSNCYLDALDQFAKRELRCAAYLRYVDDMALFADSRRTLLGWKRANVERLQSLRLVVHEGPAQVQPARCGIPWLGFVVFPTHRRVNRRNVRSFRRRLRGAGASTAPAPSPSPSSTRACRAGSNTCATPTPGACAGACSGGR